MKKTLLLLSIALLSLSTIKADDKDKQPKQLTVSATQQEWDKQLANVYVVKQFLNSSEAQSLQVKTYVALQQSSDSVLLFLTNQLKPQIK